MTHIAFARFHQHRHRSAVSRLYVTVPYFVLMGTLSALLCPKLGPTSTPTIHHPPSNMRPPLTAHPPSTVHPPRFRLCCVQIGAHFRPSTPGSRPRSRWPRRPVREPGAHRTWGCFRNFPEFSGKPISHTVARGVFYRQTMSAAVGSNVHLHVRAGVRAC